MATISPDKVPAINFTKKDLSPGVLGAWSEPSEIMHSYLKQVSELEEIVKRLIFKSFGMERLYDSLAESTDYIVRLNKYNAPRTKETTMGVVPHMDKSFISILEQNDVHGLEIQTKDGEWITMEPLASFFVVMIGEVFMAWSNDRLHCPLHRVMMTGDDERYSMALFSHSKGIVETPEEMVDEEHPLLYKPFSHSAYHIFALTKEAQKFESQIKAFCGV